DYTFTPSDRGIHSFSTSLFTAGIQTVLARDALNESMGGTATITIVAGSADHFVVTAPPTATPGVSFNVIVTALDPYGNTATSYQGALMFSTSDLDPGVALPATYTFTIGNGGDNGFHDFLGG